MSQRIITYEFSEQAFVVGSDPIVCIAPLAKLLEFMTLAELDDAFSGYACYRHRLWMKRFVGVWGRKNCQRFRRFLRERGADVFINRTRPPRIRLLGYRTVRTRKRKEF